jgi:hypothetical protein
MSLCINHELWRFAFEQESFRNYAPKTDVAKDEISFSGSKHLLFLKDKEIQYEFCRVLSTKTMSPSLFSA